MTTDDLRRIRSEAVASGILSLQHDDCLAYWGIDYEPMHRFGTGIGLRMERCPIRDFDRADMRRRLPEAVSSLSKMISNGHRVYVHCTAGMGRSPLTVLGYLSFVRGYSPDAAIRLIRAERPEAVPSWEAFDGCMADLTEQNRGAIEQRAYALYESGVNESPYKDWVQARAEVLASLF